MISGWRLAAPDYAQNPADMMSGEGAYLFGGRWNSKGTRVVYMGTSLAQAAMELLVHLNRSDVLHQYHKMEVRFEDELIEHIDLADLPRDWKTQEMASSVQAVGDDWVRSASSPILQVPSAAIDGEYNYLVNPDHPQFGELWLGPITIFEYDPRVQK